MKCAAFLVMVAGCVDLSFTSSATATILKAGCSKTDVNDFNFNTSVDVEVIMALNWSQVNIIFDADIDVDHTVRLLNDRGLLTRLVKYNPMTSTDDVIANNTSVPSSDNFLVLGSQDFVLHVFREVSSALNETTTAASHIFGNARHLTAFATQWLVLTDIRNQSVLNEAFRELDNVVVLDTSQSDLPVWTLLRSGDTTRLYYVTSLGSTTTPLSRHTLFPNLFQGLSGRTLRVVVKEVEILLSKVPEGGTQGYEGVMIDILQELSRRLNFTFILQDPPDNSYGQQLDNGQWDGLIGVLTRQEADMAMAPFRITDARAAVTDYTSPYDFEDSYLIFRTSDNNSANTSSDFYLRPLQRQVYAAMFGCLLWVLLLLLLARCVVWYTQTHRGTRPDVTRWLMADFEILLAGLFNKSSEVKEIPPPAGQVMAVTWLYVSVVLMTGVYSSQLTASLTVREEAPPFSSLQELVTQDTYTWGISAGTATRSLIQGSNNAIYKQFYDGVTRFAKTDPDVLSSSKTQFDRVLKGHYVYVTGEEKRLLYMQSVHCHLTAFKVPGLNKVTVLYLQKHSPYTAIISEAVSRMQEAGVIAHILQKWTPEPKRCEVPDSTSAIGLEQAQTAFYVLGTGMGLAVLSCLLEVWCGQTDMFKVKTKRKNCDQRIACITHDSIPGRTWAS